MRLPIDTAAVSFIVTRQPEPLLDYDTKAPGSTTAASRCFRSRSSPSARTGPRC